MVAFANVRDVMDSELRQKLMQQLQPGAPDEADALDEAFADDVQSTTDETPSADVEPEADSDDAEAPAD